MSKFQAQQSTDYDTYREIMGDLVSPIRGDGLDWETLKRLYESKAVYLENLRIKCFTELNSQIGSSHFRWSDYHLITQALKDTRSAIKVTMRDAIFENLSRRKAS